MTKAAVETINLIDLIQEGATFLDGVEIDNGEFEFEEDFVDEIVSEFTSRLGLDTHRDIFAPGDGQVTQAIEALGWTSRMEDNLDSIVFDMDEKRFYVPSEVVVQGGLRITNVFVLVGIFFLENTIEGQALKQADRKVTMHKNVALDPLFPDCVVKEIVTTCLRMDESHAHSLRGLYDL